MNNKQHWETVATKNEDEVSWFQHYPKTSMDFVNLFGLPPDAMYKGRSYHTIE